MVVAKDGVPFANPYPAVYVGSVTGFIHPAWTAEEHPILEAAGAEWIWESDPTKDIDLTNNAVYTFRKTFEWYGPVITSDLWFAVGSDNSVEVWLNGEKIAENTGEFGYRKESMLEVPGTVLTNKIVQGTNNLEFKIKNFALAGSTWQTNPAGLVYKFYLSGDCKDRYFKEHCMLWGEKDLGQETFFNFDDIKPGDWGTNLISLHVYDNDAYACLITGNIVDAENTVINPEVNAGDNTPAIGELSRYISVFAWEDDGDGNYELPESIIAGPNSSFAGAIGRIPLTATTTEYIGYAWCAGTQSLDGALIKCDGSSMGDIAQTDIMTASLTAYAEQQRNNPDFRCVPLVNGVH
jgi:hypothetical protein